MTANQREEREAFLASLPHRTVNLVAINPVDGRVSAVTRPKGHPDLLAFVTAHDGRDNLYWTVNEPRADLGDVKPKKSDINRLHHLFVDLDPSDAQPREARLATARLALDMMDNAPSFAIDSGNGVQIVWQIEPLPTNPQTIDAVEAQGRGLARRYAGDAVFNVDRILRLPGTVNLPDARKAARGRVAVPATMMGYGLFSEALPIDRYAHLAAPIAETTTDAGAKAYDGILLWPPEEPTSDLRQRLIRALARRATLRARWLGEVQVGEDPSKSGLDFRLARELRADGFGAGEAASLLWAWDFGKGADMDERYFRRLWGRNGAMPAQEEFEPVDVGEAPRRTRGLYFEHFRDLAPDVAAPALIDGLLDEGAFAVVYGASNSGKTFVALDIAHAVATGRPWFGRQTYHGPVAYVAAEAARGARKRLAALRDKYGDAADLILVPCPLDLLHASGDTAPLICLLHAAAEDMGGPFKLIVVDTLARVMAGGNENAAEDMGALVRNLDRVREETNAGLILVHHTGKDEARGARGHSSLRAAVDTEIEIADHTISVTKQREMDFAPPMKFGLDVIELGSDTNGRPVTSCTLAEEASAPSVKQTRRAAPSGNAAIALGALRDVTAPLESTADVFDEGASVPVEIWREAALSTLSGELGARRRAWSRALKTLIARGYVVEENGRVRTA